MDVVYLVDDGYLTLEDIQDKLPEIWFMPREGDYLHKSGIQYSALAVGKWEVKSLFTLVTGETLET